MTTESVMYHALPPSFPEATGQELLEASFESRLEEKDILLKESHHRVKNSLNTIMSMLNLQAAHVKDPVAYNALEDAIRRIRSMMILYEKLYQAEEYSAISATEYLADLVDEIVCNFPSYSSIRIEKQLDELTLDPKSVQSLGIIINELVTNAMKYAFVGREGGLILIRETVGNGYATVCVADNGNGFPESVSFDNSPGFGMLLVKSLAAQLRGTVRLEKGVGTRIILEFPI